MKTEQRRADQVRSSKFLLWDIQCWFHLQILMSRQLTQDSIAVNEVCISSVMTLQIAKRE